MPILGGVSLGIGRPVTLGPLNFATVKTPLGASFLVTDVDGWDGSAGSTLSTTQRLRMPGGWSSANPQLTVKLVTITGYVLGPSQAALTDGLNLLNSAVTLSSTLLSVGDPGGGLTLSMLVAQQGPVLAKGMTQTSVSFSVSLIAADPRKFGSALTVSTKLPSQSGGMAFPVSFPLSFTATTVTGSVSLTNPGTIAGPTRVTVNGPLSSGFSVIHSGGSGALRTFSTSLPLASDEFLVVDMEAETALAQGQSSRTQWVTSRGFAAFEPGPNTWSFSAPSSSSTASMTVSATPAWE